ncbi:hypothetical protein PR202_ga01576 [Eleusine coracana subsp. coracana]|uniref:1,4-alpha-glucan branching enzyme n=1 Tax=Eleusine coracana subsp. coracana TaxID=191504 RepID=A0AAV5BHL4_ELECO|nr:hypothetical protein PR202_ga00889 [Eleusine coracana subsp. coracana]GJM85778.1 hypothetical protein PR202_ga01576 [Eleusine coracana subsp. coracana]
MAVAPAFAVVSGAALGGAARAPRLPAVNGGERRRGAEPPSQALDFRRTAPCFTRNGAVRAGGLGMRAGAASKEVMVPEGESDGLTPSDESVQFESDELEVPVIDDELNTVVGDEIKVNSSEAVDEADVEALNEMPTESAAVKRPRDVPQPSTNGQRIYDIDPMLRGFKHHLEYRYSLYRRLRSDIDQYEGGLEAFSRSYEKFGFNRSAEGITYREWAPGAHSAALIGDFNNWNPNADRMSKNEFGVWEIFLPNNADGSSAIPHGSRVKEPKINTYVNFRDEVLPRIKRLGYNAVQIMAIQEHSYYGSFGYHVTNFFAPSSRFGTPEELKSLIDKAHELGLLVLMDVVHSHASSNTLDGLNCFDGTDTHYFHSGSRGYHWMWDSCLFNYGNWEVLRFLLSNARWWLEEYKFDGYRFDGVTSMMYTHHGLQVAFTGNYNEYFGFATDVDAVVYLMLVSGMPTFSLPLEDGGMGFDYRMHMAVADKWIELLKISDEAWKMADIVHSLTNRRWLEKCVTYSESHDQALVGDKTIAFWLMDKDMYDFMALERPSTPTIDRGIALHKMIRLITMGLGGEAYLNFMGNEFGHPEWIDFPRGPQQLPSGKFIPGNNNSYDKCRRRFDLFMTSDHQYISRKHEGDKVIVFEKGDLVFVFNFHCNNSYFDYRVGCLKPGKYKVVLDSDAGLFGGFGRIHHNAEHFTTDCHHDNRPHSFSVYTPSRTCVVYAPVE